MGSPQADSETEESEEAREARNSDETGSPDAPPGGASCLGLFGLFLVLYFVLVIAFALLLKLVDEDWLETEAVVKASRVESSHSGTPSWTLRIDFSYEVEGKVYTKTGVNVLHRTERDESVAEQGKWPPGHEFPVYYAANDPGNFSLQNDGGFEIKLVLVMIFLPVLLGLSMTFWVWRKRSRAGSTQVASK